jgi:hypothetical protein
MTYQEYLVHAKLQGTILTQGYLLKFVRIGFTYEEAMQDFIPDDLDPKLVLEMARKWTRERQHDKIPKSEYMAEYQNRCLA